MPTDRLATQKFFFKSFNPEVRYGGTMVLKIQSVAFELLLVMLFSGVVSGGNYGSAAAPLLDRIALGEGTTDAAAQQHGLASAYDITYAYGLYNPKDSKPLTEMTIGEVKQLQQEMITNQIKAGIVDPKKRSTAVGKYQLLSTTLQEQQEKLGLTDDAKFDAATQELFGLSLLEKRGYTDWIDGKITDHDFQKDLAKEWASVADPDTGMSYYGQQVGTTDAQIKEAMAQTKSLLGIEQEEDEITLTLYVHNGNRNGPIIPDAAVKGWDGSGNIFKETTDSSGYVTITGEPGTWSFTASADGYETKSWDQEITETDTKDAFLQKVETQQESVIPATRDSEGSIVGEWTLFYDWGCTGQPKKWCKDGICSGLPNTQLFFKSDGTMIAEDDHKIVKWGQDGDNIYWTWNNDVTYEGTIQTDTMSGTMSSTISDTGEIDTGCWSASKISTDNPEKQSNSEHTQSRFSSQVTLTLYIHEGSESGPIIPDALVAISDGNMSHPGQPTNSQGYLERTGEQGTWSFTASADGYETKSWDQEITEDCTKHEFLQQEQQQEPVENSVVGKWIIKSDVDCDGDLIECDEVGENGEYISTVRCEDEIVTFNADGTIGDDSGNSDYSDYYWEQYGDTIHWKHNPEYEYDGSSDESWRCWSTYDGTIKGNTMEGTFICKEAPERAERYGLHDTTGCWSAVRVDT